MKRIRGYIGVLILSFLVTGSSLAQSWTLDPGEGVGAITLDMTSSAAKAVLKPTRIFGSKKSPALVEYGKDLIVEYIGNKAAIISLHGNSFETKNGRVSWVPYKGGKIGAEWAGVASQLPATKVSHKLPTAKGHPVEMYHAYRRLGIGFRVKGNKITQVDVWRSK